MGYGFSFATRLRMILEDVLQDYREVVNELVGDGDTRQSFITTVKNTRDYLTHYPPSLKQKAITDSNELYEYAQKMKRIMQLCFLKEMGFPVETVKSIASRGQFSYWVKG